MPVQEKKNFCEVLLSLLLSINHVSEIWREYVGYDFDLDLPSVLLAPDLVSNGNNYTDFVDGNPATCVDMDSTSCGPALKVKYIRTLNVKSKYKIQSSGVKNN